MRPSEERYEISARIKRLRNRMGISGPALAKITGLKYGLISNYEESIPKKYCRLKLGKIATALNVNLDDLEYGE